MALTRRLKILECNTNDRSMKMTTFKVAFASTDMKHVNQHFGSAESFVIYVIDSEQSKMLEVAQFGNLEQDGNEDKLLEKMTTLEGCIAVYTQAVGASAVKQLKAIGIQPVKVSAGAEINDLILSIQDELQSGPGTWLARAIDAQKAPDPKRFDNMEAEGWDE